MALISACCASLVFVADGDAAQAQQEQQAQRDDGGSFGDGRNSRGAEVIQPKQARIRGSEQECAGRAGRHRCEDELLVVEGSGIDHIHPLEAGERRLELIASPVMVP